jgi:hypothetical protein
MVCSLKGSSSLYDARALRAHKFLRGPSRGF